MVVYYTNLFDSLNFNQAAMRAVLNRKTCHEAHKQYIEQVQPGLKSKSKVKNRKEAIFVSILHVRIINFPTFNSVRAENIGRKFRTRQQQPG